MLLISATGPVTFTNSVDTNVLTWSHTVSSGTDRALFVEVTIGTTGTIVNGVTYNGAALTLVGRPPARSCRWRSGGCSTRW